MARTDKPQRQRAASEGEASELRLLSEQVQAITRFPDQNPNPVLRISRTGELLYANTASLPIRLALGVEVGDQLASDTAERLLASAESGMSVEVEHEHQTFAVLPVAVEDMGFVNLYGTDVTAKKAIDKFPDENPNPVLRVNAQGELIYANAASAPIVEGQRLERGRPIPRWLRAAVDESLAAGKPQPIQLACGELVFEVLPVAVPEFDFVNLYGTDVTAARQIEEANRENERLLLNILPPAIAERLRRGERIIADRFDDVTLLMADIVGFTNMSSHMAPTDVVGMLNEIFSTVDELVDRHGLEKVKTIGDAYMVVGGLPSPLEDHVARAAEMALALVKAVDAMPPPAGQAVRLRVGIHCGPAVAGVIGVKKFIYDVWGDTVNLASRMEALGQPGRIQVTHAVQQRLARDYRFEARGLIDVKGVGPMPTYFLTGRRRQLRGRTVETAGRQLNAGVHEA